MKLFYPKVSGVERLRNMGFKEIGDYVSVSKNTLSYYLNVLEKKLDLIERIVPATETLEKSKKGRYIIKDNFFRFWFKFVFPDLSMLELENTKPVAMQIKKEVSAFIGVAFEGVVRELVIDANKYDLPVANFNLPLFRRIGSWWDRKGNEIDICAVSYDKSEILFGEVKWRTKKTDVSEVMKLINKTTLIPWNGKKTLMFVSKAGFTKDAEKVIRENGVMGIDLKDINEFYDKLQKIDIDRLRVFLMYPNILQKG